MTVSSRGGIHCDPLCGLHTLNRYGTIRAMINKRLLIPHWLTNPVIQVMLVFAAGLLVRLALASFAPHPGVADPNHYYNLARNLADGRGFVIDYIWQYHSPPPGVTHPIDYWMPLPAIWPMLGFLLGGESLLATLLPSVIFGALIAVLTYGLAAAVGLAHPVRLMAMAGTVFLPEFVLNAVRTDTTITYVLFVGLALLCFYEGMRRRPRLLFLAGLFAGLAQLTRQDGMLLAPALAVAVLVYWRWGGRPVPWRWLLALGVGWLLVLAPWLWRNYSLYGYLLPGGTSRTMFMTFFNDQFTYGRTLDLDHYLAWGWPNIIGNIGFHILANVKISYMLLDVGLPILALLGLRGIIVRQERELLLLLVAPMIFVLGLFLFYSLITPFHSMGGSFKKSYMILIPFLAVAGAWALDAYVRPKYIATLAAVLMAGFMLLNAVELVRLDYSGMARYSGEAAALADFVREQGDISGDGVLTVMAQDPYMMNYHGLAALMLPSDPREMILEAVARYGVDYIVLPADRPALDDLFDGQAPDPRLRWLEAPGHFQLLAVDESVYP